MIRMVSFAAALTGAGLLLAPLTLHAAAPSPAAAYYSATPAATASRAGFITRSTVWRMSGASFVAARGPERDKIQCELVAEEAGTLSAFSAGGQAFDSDALAKCNAHAR